MEKLRTWIKRNGNLKKFLNDMKISRSTFSDWELGKRGISLELASRIVYYTNGFISYEDLINFQSTVTTQKTKDKAQNQSSDQN